MELKQLRYFVGVSEAGSLLAASRRLHIAQPALGQQIVALERELGTPLFERSNRGMALTDAGRILLEHARLLLGDAERAARAVRHATSVPAGEVSIGLPTTVALTATMSILRACRRQLPEVRLKIVEAYSGFLREWLESGRLDVAVLFGDQPEPGLDKTALLDDRLVFLAGAGGRRLPARMTLARLPQWPLILPGREHGLRRIIDDACAPLGIALDVVAEIEALGSVKRAVEEGMGCTILPMGSVAEELADGRLRMATLDNAGMVRRVVCATNLTRRASTASAAVAVVLQQVLHDMVASGAWPARWLGGARP